MTNENVGHQINRLEEQMRFNKELIDLAVALERLQSNPDFIKIITEGYFRDLAVQCVAFKGSPQCINQVEADTDREILGIGKLQNYFASIRRNAQTAENNNADCLEAIAELEQGEEE
jgi:hypothetical protein